MAGVDLPYQLPQAVSQYWGFRQQVIAARGQVLSADRALRGLLGMKSDDGTIFKPTDEPTEAKFKPDFAALYADALQQRPELELARQEVKVQQLSLLAQKNQRMPDLRVGAFYDVNGLGARLDGGRDVNAFASLASNQFNSWQMFVRLDMPLGFRDANALVRQNQLNLWRSYIQLQDSERKVYEVLVDAYRRMDEAYATIEVARAGRIATNDLVQQLNDRFRGGISNPQEYINLLQAQRDLARATSDEYRAIAQYNTALAQIEFAKGTIQQYNNVSIADGPLPNYVQKKATDHFRAQSLALKLRDRPAGLPLAGLNQYQMMNMETLPDIRPGSTVPSTLPSGIVPQPTTPQLLPPPLNQPQTMPAPQGLSSNPAPTQIKQWDSWQNAPAQGSIVPMPAGTAEGSNFRPIGTLTLPTRKPADPAANPGAFSQGTPVSGPSTPISSIPR
jgi:hypothetical protein